MSRETNWTTFIHIYSSIFELDTFMKLRIMKTIFYSGVASPICQKGQSEITFPIFTLSSWFFCFSWFFPNFSPLFPDFLQIFRVKRGILLPCPCTGYAIDFLPLVWNEITIMAGNQQFRKIGKSWMQFIHMVVNEGGLYRIRSNTRSCPYNRPLTSFLV